MVVLLLFCYDLFLYTIDFVILTKFMDSQYGTFQRSHIQKNIMIMLIAILSCILLWSSPFGGTYPFFSVILSFIFIPFYKSNKQKELLLSSVQIVVSAYLVTLVLALLQSFEINLRYIGVNYYLTLCFMHIIFWLLILVLDKFSKKDSVILPSKLLKVVLAIPLSSFIVLAFFMIRANNNTTMLFSLEIPLLCVFIFINIMAAFMYSQFGDLLKKNSEILLLRQQLNLSEQHFQDITNAQQKLKGIRHDMKNHLQTLLLMSNQASGQLESIKKYIQQLLSKVNDTAQIISTGNLGIDSILSLKIAQIKDEQISVTSKIVIPAGIPIPFDDSIIIFGNIFDNAIDACKKISPQNRFIRLEIAYIHHSLFIRMSNPNSSLDRKNLVTNSEEHGFGLKNVHTVILKYNGTMNIEDINNVFTIKIVLYNL